ncbi:NAC domain-containing protein 100-like [Eucalyptus grandis]|uniref:NAC domain-containing protein 100-like n=1 Tax=Eucalyptus grandis TaxID=71139 RepID=UPI00192EAEB1|nr:NAC domain-containing protein 100-like [Eucalyptus grandis]
MSILPPGFRFHATDEELLLLYLKPKILGQPEEHYSNIIPEIDVCESEPWQLPAMFDRKFNRKELFFYCRVKRKYVNSRRSDHTTRAGQRTNWVMHEYHLNSKFLGGNHAKGEMLPYVACRIKNKKDKKLTMGHAPAISPEVYSSSPLTSASNMSMGEIMDSLCPIQRLDDRLPDYNNTPTFQPQVEAGAEEEEVWSSYLDFSYDNNGNEFDYGRILSPCSNSANFSGWAAEMLEDFSTASYNGGA